MKKRWLKVISVLLAFVLVFSQAGVVFAKAKNVVPVILIHGLGGNALYENVGTENETKIPDYGLDIKTLLTDSAVMSEAVKLLTEEQSVNWDALFKALGNYFRNSNINCNKNGNAKAGQGINNYWLTPLSKHKDYWRDGANAEAAIARQLCETQGSKNVYMFNYDWRLDVRQTAKSLRKEVVAVKKRTGAKKVALVGCSLGGAVMSAYLDAYKSKKDIARYIFVNPAYWGVDVARMFRFDVKLNKKAVLAYLKHMEKEYDGGSQETLFKVIGALGDEKINTAVDNLNKVARNRKLLKKMYLTVVKDWIGNIPAYWECIPYKDFKTCVKCMSKIGFLDTKSGLYKKIKAYHSN